MITDVGQISGVNPAGIPQAMKNVRRWCCWAAVPKQKADGTVEYTKEPRRGHAPGKRASSTDAATWCDFETAYAHVQTGEMSGVGFVLGDGWAGVDLDDAFVGADLRPDAAAIVSRLSSFTERSVSKTGVHVIVHAELHRGIKTSSVEVYGEGRYFTMSGDRLDGCHQTVESRQAELDALVQDLQNERARNTRSLVPTNAVSISDDRTRLTPPPPASDEEIIERAHRACRGFADLWAGNIAKYDGDDSRADLALAGYLAFMCGPEQDGLVRRLMEQSRLKRDKWVENRTYLERTISKAYGERGEDDFFHWNGHPRKAELVPISVPSPGTPPDRGLLLDLTHSSTVDDTGFARRLAEEGRDHIRYVTSWGKWITWDGSRWNVDDGTGAVQQAQILRDRLWHEFADLPLKKKTALALKYIKQCGSAKKIRDIVGLLRHQQPIRISHEQLDQHRLLLNLRNGTIDLRTGECLPHDREHFITQMAAVAYQPFAEADLWEQFIHEAMLGDAELIRFLQVSAGLMLSGDVSVQAMWCHHGNGANGKSTFLGTIANLLGDYATAAPPNFLMTRQTESHPTEIANLYGKRLVTAIECEGGKRMRESFVKMLTGGDKMAARRMHENFWTVDPTWHLHVAFNDPPTITGTDDGIRRRLKIIPWRADFRGAKQDKSIKERLESEEMRPGILNWCLAGFRDYLANGLPSNSAVEDATAEYVSEQDVLGVFLDEECVIGPACQVVFPAFLKSFHGWLETRGEHPGYWSGKKVGADLKRRGFYSEKCSSGYDRNKTVYHGIRLIHPPL
jgi:putative DNA primase/helicase